MSNSLGTLMVPALIIVLSLGVLVPAQDTTYPVVVVNYRELRLVPESMLLLNESHPVFVSEAILVHLLSDNNTLFWEAIGHFGETLDSNSSVSTFVLVQINNTGFNEFLVGLSLDNTTLRWVTGLNSSITADFGTIVQAATGFFMNRGHYWGLCEELIVLPGSLVGQSQDIVWRARFHQIAESEKMDTSPRFFRPCAEHRLHQSALQFVFGFKPNLCLGGVRRSVLPADCCSLQGPGIISLERPSELLGPNSAHG